MFPQRITAAPPDAILGLTEEFKKDPHPYKVNLGVGVFVDETGRTPVLKTVRRAEEKILREETSKSYLPIAGSPDFRRLVRGLMLGEGSGAPEEARVALLHAPGGTGALRLGAEVLRAFVPSARIWLSAPTWPNHRGLLKAAGFALKEYPYYDPATRGLAFEALHTALAEAGEDDVVVLHACCHNPSGVDLSPAQWQELADLAVRQRWIPFFDFAYQGFAEGLDADRAGLLPFLKTDRPVFVAGSFSKNFGLYNERTGALAFVGPTAEETAAMMTHLQATARVLYSNPPAHGGAIVAAILGDPAARREWEGEVTAMRERIHAVRHALADGLERRGAGDFSFIRTQQGMFSFSGLNDAQVRYLREKKSIYIVGGGRINVAGIIPSALDRVCDAIAEALKIPAAG